MSQDVAEVGLSIVCLKYSEASACVIPVLPYKPGHKQHLNTQVRRSKFPHLVFWVGLLGLRRN